MKLNATSELLPVSRPDFANIHPFAPAYQTQGYFELIKVVLPFLISIIEVSIENSGSHGNINT